MEGQSRTKNSAINILFSLGGYAVTLILQLVGRSIFLERLSADYLGLGGLFSSILSMLALSELGIGSAIIYALYKPISENNVNKIKSLMAVYRKMYTAIGCFVLLAGILVTPFLRFLIKDMPDIPYIKIYFLLYVANSAFSYFCTYKRSLIVCNQKEYISTTTTSIAAIVLRVLQIVILLTTGNYFLYLMAQIIVTLGENLWISHIANKMYPYIREKDAEPLGKDDTQALKKNILAMFGHKLGNVIVNTTDSLIISKILGLAAVGLFSNYNLILSNLQSIYGKVFNALSASIGNLTASTDSEHSEDILNALVLVAYFIQSTLAACLFVLFQDFIKLWLGENYLFSQYTVAIIVCNFYISNMRTPVMTFRNATGTFWNDRYKPIIESVVNLVVSIPLTFVLGVGGVKLGTIISTLTAAFWMEAYVLYKYYFGKTVGKYLLKQLCLCCLTLIITTTTYFIGSFIPCLSIMTFLLKAVLCCAIPIIINLILFNRTKEFRLVMSKIKALFVRRIHHE